MPFTIAHVAAAPPLYRLSRRRLVLTALAIGSVSPDFEYFVQLRPERTISHTSMGVFTVCLPASLVVLWLWHRFLGPALAPQLPGKLRAAAAEPFRFWPLSRFVWICLSILVGAFSHIAWDSFTHEESFIVGRYARLRAPLWHGVGPARYIVLWYVSSILGLLLTTWWLARVSGVLRRRRKRIPVNWLLLAKRFCTCTPVAAAALIMGKANVGRVYTYGITRQEQLVAGVIGAITGAALALVVVAAVLRVASFCRRRALSS